MNTTQTALIKLVHADALEMTKNNAEQVLALYGALMEFSQSTPQVAPETEADLEALEGWLTKAIGEERIAELMGIIDMTITERIEAAIHESRRQGCTPTAVVLGPLEAGEFFTWLIDQPHVRLGSRWEEKVYTMIIKDIEGMTYNGLPIRLSEKDGIDILT